MDRNNIQRLSERRARRLPLPEMEALNQPGVRMPQGPEATTGQHVPRRQVGKRTFGRIYDNFVDNTNHGAEIP